MSSITMPYTVIGYCPVIAGSPTEYSTICTVLKSVQEMSKQLGQSIPIVTFDLAIYTKAKEIHWRYPEEFQDLVTLLEGFHIARKFLELIGKNSKRAALIESGVYRSSSTLALLQGKSYNRGVRAYKLPMEALMRLQWVSFCFLMTKGGWISSKEEGGANREEERLNSDLGNSVVEPYRSAAASEERKEVYIVLCNTTGHDK